jgi:hypothetical protein
VVPQGGLIDVHNYATLQLFGERVVLDVTFPSVDWDGMSAMEVASGPGTDQLAGRDFMAEKQQLVSVYCDPTERDHRLGDVILPRILME